MKKRTTTKTTKLASAQLKKVSGGLKPIGNEFMLKPIGNDPFNPLAGPFNPGF